jgi:ABC transporter substrate binding protein
MSQMRAVLSPDAVTMRDPSGLKAAERRSLAWPRRTAISLALAASQMRAVLSYDAVTMRNPSGLKAEYTEPPIAPFSEFAESGGLLSYGASFATMFHYAAYYVDRILKGASPGDLPMEQPTKFELCINLKTAKALGLTVPDKLLVAADR